MNGRKKRGKYCHQYVKAKESFFLRCGVNSGKVSDLFSTVVAMWRSWKPGANDDSLPGSRLLSQIVISGMNHETDC
ncbi:hypothetical protein SAMN04487894_10969 [Niabella drilacis]|uniref:Uncharacterized protein n=1 Tax=Niabella drilacis (strain DSM 25811 / CCM 8410 / CCUG 62505 / LMG 26954 / E90) TaxID=1285928 RepID=A0A1G6URF5_NIADE|nr:hypothetical protein SAMN04487894_10969 [Niabella drilacis]